MVANGPTRARAVTSPTPAQHIYRGYRVVVYGEAKRSRLRLGRSVSVIASCYLRSSLPTASLVDSSKLLLVRPY